jgi:ABC-2 type transport system ATP-binding protein
MNFSGLYFVRNLMKKYRNENVLNGIDLEFSESQLFALIGQNGSGKSTLMRLLAQRELGDGGDIFFKGESLKSPTLELQNQIVFIDEEQILPLAIPLHEWVEHYARLYPQYDLKIFGTLAEQLAVDPKKSFHELSRGQRVKALFCLQAPKRPQVYLLDEITAVLDRSSRLAMLQFLNRERARGALVVMSTNIASEMQGFATHICVLQDGRVSLNCKVSELPDRFAKVRTEAWRAVAVESMRQVQLNSDGTWSYLLHRPMLSRVSSVLPDKREITVEDVATYFCGKAV